MKKKLFISTLAIVLILSMSIAMFAGCNGNAPEFGEQTLGTTKPTNVETSATLTEGMSAFEMLEVGIENFYDADYVASFYNGSVKTKVIGMTITQLVESLKIRKGKGDIEGNNANGASYFADSRSYSSVAKLYEQMIITPDDIRYINATKSGTKYDKKTGTWSIKEWNAEQTGYVDVLDFADEKQNNPTILWMYNLKEDYVIPAGKELPVKKNAMSETTAVEKKDGYYTFTISFDPTETTKDYIGTMKQQLEVNAGMGVDGLTFEELKLEVELWDNGMFKRLFITESYFMKMAGIINSSITLYSDTQFTYEEVDGYKYDENVATFGKI